MGHTSQTGKVVAMTREQHVQDRIAELNVRM
jgi:hypothetical protein